MKSIFSHVITFWRIAVFGGLAFCIGNSVIGQVRTFDSGSDGSDGPLVVAGTLPPGERFSAVYDSERNQVVAVGGGGSTQIPDDPEHTYIYDDSGWIRVSRDIGPAGRLRPAMAYDSIRKKIVLFGGIGYSNYTDTWQWDGAQWTELITANSPPMDHSNQSMAFDESSGLTTLVLQRSSFSPELETWTFDGVNWTQESATIPHRGDMMICYDETLEMLVLLIEGLSGDTIERWTYDGTVWTLDAASFPYVPLSGDFIYDGRTGRTAFYGEEIAYEYTNDSWDLIEGVPADFELGAKQLVYHPVMNALLNLNGSYRDEEDIEQTRNNTTAWFADDSIETLAKGEIVFDMNEKPNGLWHYTTIDIGPNVDVTFQRNEENTPVRWLASDDVAIDGNLDLSAKQRTDIVPVDFDLEDVVGAYGGPGGFDGAASARTGSDFVIPGEGPGGGFYDGVFQSSANGEFSSYGNAWLYPTIGGSGGSSKIVENGGGGGGGALLIASNGDLSLNGKITAKPVTYNGTTGSGGAVLLRANRLMGEGDVDVATGRLRLDAWENSLADSITGFDKSAQSGRPLLPTDTNPLIQKLWIDSIDSLPVANPPVSHDTIDMLDVSPAGSGEISIVVKGENIPAGAEVSLFVSLEDGSTLEPSPVAYDGTQATFSVDLPDGYGAIAAEVSFPVE